LQVRHAEESEFEEVLEITQEAFRKGSAGSSTGEFERTIVEATVTDDPNFCRGDLRIVEVESRIVSMMLIIRRQVRIGKSEVKNAIVSPVATRPGYERKGYCSLVMRDGVNYMKEQGFNLTTLWGHPWLYKRYGYTPAMTSPSIAIKPEKCTATKFPSGFTADPFAVSQTKTVTDIYHQNTKNQMLAEIRHPEPFEWNIRSPTVDFKTVSDRKGRVVGYYAMSAKALPERSFLEIGVDNIEACRAVYNTTLKHAKQKGLTEIVCSMSPRHPYARFAYWHNAELRKTMGSGAGFAQILDVPRLLTGISKELQRRVSLSEYCNKSASMSIKTERGTSDLLIHDGEVTASGETSLTDCTIKFSNSSLTPLVTGYMSVHELVEQQEVTIERKAQNRLRATVVLRLVDILFPKNTPFGSNLPLFWE